MDRIRPLLATPSHAYFLGSYILEDIRLWLTAVLRSYCWRVPFEVPMESLLLPSFQLVPGQIRSRDVPEWFGLLLQAGVACRR